MEAPTTSAPLTLCAGDTWQWTRSLSEYPAPAWSVSARLVSATASFSATVSPSGAAHKVTFAAASTAGIPAGAYTLVESVSDGTDRHIVTRIPVTVTPDPMTGNADLRSAFRKALDQARAHLVTYASSGTWRATEITVADRTTKCSTPEQLRGFIRMLEVEVAREENELAGRASASAASTWHVNFGSSQ